MSLKRSVLEVAVSSARTLAKIRAISSKGPNALVVPCTGHGSLGDAAMLNVTHAMLKAKGFYQIDVMIKPGWSALEPYDHEIDCDSYFYGGRRQLAPIVARMGKYSDVYFVGADVVDGVYGAWHVVQRLSLISEAARLGLNATILGCSFSETPNPDCVRTLRELPRSVRINARDPISKRRMEALLDRPIELVADLAFLTPARSEAPEALEVKQWAASRRAAGDHIVALNANSLHDAEFPGYAGGLQDLVGALLKQKISLLLVPHDTRKLRSDQFILHEATAKLGSEYIDRLKMLEPVEPGIIKASLAHADLLVTGRMHAAILAMGVGRPAICFTYQGKFEGLYELAGLNNEGLLLAPDAIVENPANLATLVSQKLNQSAVLSRKILNKLPEILELSRANFAN